MMKNIPDKDILLFKSCLVSTEYPGIESSTKYVFDKVGIDYDISNRQTCCTGLGHYSDIFDQYSTTVIGARNFHVANELNKKNLVMLCATCYAINKKVANILNNKHDTRAEINKLFRDSNLDEMQYEKDSIDSRENIFHVVDILYNKKEEIAKNIKFDVSKFKIATHHGCHYCKVHYNDTIGGIRDPNIIDDIVTYCGGKTIAWYDHKKTTCGAGFRQRFVNKDLSMDVTLDKLKSINNDGVEILIHLCPNCHVQFDRYQKYIDSNKEFNMIHLNIAQFIALAMGADPYKVVGIQTHSESIEPFIEELKENVLDSTLDEKIVESDSNV
ncbi:ferredoxin:CoB-CoM heterodisulfide reductase subunit HdrB [Methanobrevibacter sp. DSM 116169]|uniref:ferredoxin:CoB-CoM heterodisulfide reductase subunit HdrB n=1 Tax=Methanobrevibacter sp. DSM 116169 TaxID=3242727 RepID=UPI0038FBEC93